MIVNGQFQTEISITDRALQYGDGCFTTIACRNGCLEFYDDHIQRLKTSCHKLAIQFSAWEELTRSIHASLQNLNDQTRDLVIKVLISRGQGGRGYSPKGCSTPNYIITHHPYPQHYNQLQQNGIKLTVSPIQLAKQPLLAGIKHLNRMEQVLIKNDLLNSDFDDALVCDTDGAIIESSIANCFWKQDGQWFTPDLTHSGVEGVMRKQVIYLFEKHGINLDFVKKMYWS
ncbi:aminodeoxychorismate lyase [Paraglaciecola aquimarina]|uniref:Aminodeoxychorismate lyase n=1 Tax=Paraglaciecola aquimarina TaxID=1235557 RepID=A0ABU3SZ69_9ALTE|nr:aminodeoxychorismate lyase [Paraglaciecola aquimarina]MDU0355309.1 aminodeoxychorismate lyase [Paraglaciecola aquimarina]